MESLGLLGLAVCLFIFVVSIFITVSPLIIWRNGNRTNRLLSLIALQLGTPADRIKKIYNSKLGSKLPEEIEKAIELQKPEKDFDIV